MKHRLAICATAALVLTGCGGNDGASDATGTNAGSSTDDNSEAGPIHVGSISGITGQFRFPESAQAAEAYFEKVNAEGGINGRKIQYHVEDDKTDPALAAQAARKLVDNQDVVAMVGSASLVECSANAAFYVKQEVAAIQGTGVDPQCFNSPNISPVNTGPFQAITVGLYFATTELDAKKACFISNQIPDWNPAMDKAVARWESITDQELALQDRSLQANDDLTPFVLRAQKAGCDAVYVNGQDFQAIALMKAAEQQGITDIDWIFPTGVYTEAVAETLGDADGLYAVAEFELLDSDKPEVKDMISTLEDADVPLTSFAEGGYLAAQIFTDVAKGIDGDITRESVTAALKETTDVETALIGSPYSFGPGDSHNSNTASKFVRVEDGKWVPVADEWVTLPD